MRLLADSHVLVWWLDDPSRLTMSAREAIADPENEVFLSAASVWELGLKIARGKLLMPADFVSVLIDDGFNPLPVRVEHAETSIHLPRHHDDPFDRMLIAQTKEEGLVLATRDRLIFDYDIPLLKA